MEEKAEWLEYLLKGEAGWRRGLGEPPKGKPESEELNRGLLLH